jgi:hypothetical protein
MASIVWHPSKEPRVLVSGRPFPNVSLEHSLVANAVMLRNVADLTDVLADVKADGHDFTREQVVPLSPYRTTHLKRFGQ